MEQNNKILPLIALIAVFAIAGLGVFVYFKTAENDKLKNEQQAQNETVIVSGKILSVDLENKKLTVLDSVSSELKLVLNVDAKIVDEAGQTADLSYFQPGFKVTAIGLKNNQTNEINISNLEVTNASKIVVLSPVENDTVGQIITIEGKARVFENQFNIRIKKGSKTLADLHVFASSSDPSKYGTYKEEIHLPASVSDGEELVIEAVAYSAKDGGIDELVSVPVNYKSDNKLTEYYNDQFKVSLNYPVEWLPATTSNKFQGANGFFSVELDGTNKATINDVVKKIITENKSFNSSSTIEEIKIAGVNGKIIRQSNNLSDNQLAKIILPLPSVIKVGASSFSYLILTANQNDIFKIGNTLVFGEKPKLTVKLFFGNSKMGSSEDCEKVFSQDRQITYTQSVGKAALEELFKGPSAAEKSKGYFSSLNSGIKIQNLEIGGGVAKVDFNQALQYKVAGSCRVTAIRAQIEETLKQFPSVKKVIITIDGKEDILQP